MKDRHFFFIIFISLISRLFFFDNFVWWDGSVYLGMGKFIFSLGQRGLWEPIRPVLLPFFLGFFWKLFPSMFIVLSKLFMFSISLISIFLVYKISITLFNKQTAFLASIFFSFSSIFFFFTFRVYSDILAVFFVLLSFYFYIKSRFQLSGFVLALAFLSRFPSGIFLVCFLIPLLFKKDFKNSGKLLSIFVLTILPYLLFNHFFYGNAFFPFVFASKIVDLVVGCNFLRPQPFYFYFVQIFKDNFLNIFIFAGIYFSLKNKVKHRFLLSLCFFLPFLYFSFIGCREYRYLILFLPFISFFSAFGISNLIKKFDKSKKSFAIILILLLSLSSALIYSVENSYSPPTPKEFSQFLKNKQVTGEVWSSNPEITIHSNNKIIPIYFPVWSSKKISSLDSKDAQFIFLDSCAGGMFCSPLDKACPKKTLEFIQDLNNNFVVEFDESVGVCDYLIFSSS